MHAEILPMLKIRHTIPHATNRSEFALRHTPAFLGVRTFPPFLRYAVRCGAVGYQPHAKYNPGHGIRPSYHIISYRHPRPLTRRCRCGAFPQVPPERPQEGSRTGDWSAGDNAGGKRHTPGPVPDRSRPPRPPSGASNPACLPPAPLDLLPAPAQEEGF